VKSRRQLLGPTNSATGECSHQIGDKASTWKVSFSVEEWSHFCELQGGCLSSSEVVNLDTLSRRIGMGALRPGRSKSFMSARARSPKRKKSLRRFLPEWRKCNAAVPALRLNC
jgi:hypothetical protein